MFKLRPGKLYRILGLGKGMVERETVARVKLLPTFKEFRAIAGLTVGLATAMT